MRLTDPKVFERRLDEATGDWVVDRRFLEDAPREGAVFTFSRDEAGEPLVCLDGVPLAQRFTYHSPTGFEWGYGGSGPADLALNILGLFITPPEAWALHQGFKWSAIAHIPRRGGQLSATVVRAWIELAFAGHVQL